MRFIDGGPNIPDLLLNRRDQGKVVFLCGAGVSRNAGMPLFYELTKSVVEFFDPPKGSTIESEFGLWLEDEMSGKDRPKAPLDQIFQLLHQEYGREEVNSIVAQQLSVTEVEPEKLNNHSVIGRIASDQDGRPQVVTTNFDQLFEMALSRPDTQVFEPPALPNLELGMSLTGVTYLHGRLQDSTAKLHPYVLSSADFGRAYLSEAWATNFIRSLLKSYTVVLVGYKAEDPPVKYLLQGLNHDGLSDRSNLYAFDEGEPEDVEAKWRDRGVTAIAFKDFERLWQSLEAWADRADYPRQWRSSVIDLARKGARLLSAHERGQVAHLVRTTPGARLFAQSEPSPPSEWLCVFDTRCRTVKVNSSFEAYDPIEEYGLDDDPEQLTGSDGDVSRIYDNILGWRREDTNPPDSHSLGGREIAGFEKMPRRLSHLANWITKHLNSPTTAWWAMRQKGLHPNLMREIQRQLMRNDDIQPKARRAWNLILEYQSDSRSILGDMDFGWYGIKDRIKHEGWSPSVLRSFETVSAPYLSCQYNSCIHVSKWPLNCWNEIDFKELASWEVKFSDMHDTELDVPDEVLESVFYIANRNIRRACGLLKDLDTTHFSVPTCYPDREADGQDGDGDTTFDWFFRLFVRIVSESPATARDYANSWPLGDMFYYKKIKLFALNQAELFAADEAAESVLLLSQSDFWDRDVRRELLFVISDRWDDFSGANRSALVERLLNGPDRVDCWSDDDYPEIKADLAWRYIRWLQLQDRVLSEDQELRFSEMVSGLPERRDSWASSFLTEHSSYVIGILTDEKPDQLIQLPVAEVVEHAKVEHQRDFGSSTERRPFIGLVKDRPRKALLSLIYSANRDIYPQELWAVIIDSWPEETSSRLYRVFLHRIRRLPHSVIRELRYDIGRWIRCKLLLAFTFDSSLAWSIFDHLVSGLLSEGSIESEVGEVHVGGEIDEHSIRTYEIAVSSPIGDAVEGMINALNSLKLEKGNEIPGEFKTRFEKLIAALEEGGDHSVATISRQISWLHYLDPDWVNERVMPWFNFDHTYSEPAWSGYLAARKIHSGEIGAALKPLFLDLFPRIYQWNFDPHVSKIATQIITDLAVFHSNERYGFNDKEARHCLRNMNDENRQDAVNRLNQSLRRDAEESSEHVISFIKEVWPWERAFRTSKLVSSWVSLLGNSGDKFPEVLNVVHRNLAPVSKNHWLYRFSMNVGEGQPLATQYPECVLEMLDAIIPNSVDDSPNELSHILELVEEAEPALVGDRRFNRLVALVENT